MNAILPPNDAAERAAALNPRQSFIVQAPAGSGKTELLIQRFLVLLAEVQQPEEILSITFTKKAAAEMRDRIIQALNNAAHHAEPVSAHSQTTWRLAQRVLARDNQLKWQLLANPNRLRVKTIDAFNAYLTKQLPILAHFGAAPEITNHPLPLYRAAIQEFLTHLEENVAWSQAIAELLLHLDNDLLKVENLLITMLAKRDQWLPYMSLNVPADELRQALEQQLAAINADALQRLHNLFPVAYSTELCELLYFAANNLLQENSPSAITACGNLRTLPDTDLSSKTQWRSICELLVTKEGNWRKRIDKTIGFPAPSNAPNSRDKQFYKDYKERMQELLLALTDHTDLLDAFKTLMILPDAEYSASQWQILAALYQVLRILVAQLKLIFQQQGQIDYIENAAAALTALGSEDAPTDLSLALDYQIKHILIDEFQDTSHNQFRLIEKLLAGWEANDGRTLFIVGDPMQSIYRFREAEVGLFIRARLHGIAAIKLTPLTLRVNFRSHPTVVNWVNHHFQAIFPRFDDIASGAVTYSASTAAAQSVIDNGTLVAEVKLHPCPALQPDYQTQKILQCLQQIQNTAPESHIAILVRSRSHLRELIPALKQAGIAYQAIDIDPLFTRPVIQDLLALTRALLHPADRVAWFAILRAPWCGFTLSDLLTIAGTNFNVSIWERLNDTDLSAGLSDAGQQQLTRILPILKLAIAERQRYALRDWLEQTWLALGGPATVDHATDLLDTEVFFELIATLEVGGELPKLDDLTEYAERLFAATNHATTQTISIMTIHNAKGLEFDAVLIPHLEARLPSDEKQLLLWMEQALAAEESALLLGPIHGAGLSHDPIYHYIKSQHNQKDRYETARLLYVAATRAKQQLHIFCNVATKEEALASPPSSSLLATLWPALSLSTLQQDVVNLALLPHTVPAIAEAQSNIRPMKRLTVDWQHPVPALQPKITQALHLPAGGFKLPDHEPRIIGTVIHRVLQQLAMQGIDWWQAVTSAQQARYLQTQLLQLGMRTDALPQAITIITQAITNILADPRGQWILAHHAEAQSEFPLSICQDQRMQSLIIDRTFIDEEGIRWIIDYKTSAPGALPLEEFLQTEQQHYAAQMQNYAAAFQALAPRPIRLGLYFPLIPAFCSWEYQPNESTEIKTNINISMME